MVCFAFRLGLCGRHCHLDTLIGAGSWNDRDLDKKKRDNEHKSTYLDIKREWIGFLLIAGATDIQSDGSINPNGGTGL
jgi:hypothetical protein